jgi:UDPglucose 6-dehydrogenase
VAAAKSLAAGTTMRITVLGLWHLGCVTAACCAERFPVQGLDFDPGLVTKLTAGKPPISEPGLEELLQAGLRKGSLSFSTEIERVCAETDILWVCFDTPVDDDDRADVEFVLSRVRRCLTHLTAGSIVLISSQMPVGTCKQLNAEFPQFSFACSPENLQLGRALDAFRKPARIIVGARDEAAKGKLQWLFGHFSDNLLMVSPESAEMIKHGLNSFLALSVSFINEIARVCELFGADARQVEAGLKSDIRIGPRAYLSPGPAFAGGTLARDVAMLTELGKQFGEKLVLIPAIKQSNDQHKEWARLKLERLLGNVTGKTVAVLGLTYKPFTDTLRRSSSIELCRRLAELSCNVKAFDPAIKELQMAGVLLCPSATEALTGADAAVLATPWPEFRDFNWGAATEQMRRALVLDPHGFVKDQVRAAPRVEYHTVGLSEKHVAPHGASQ